MNLSDRLTVIGQDDDSQRTVRKQRGAMGAAMVDCEHPAPAAIARIKSRFIVDLRLYVSSCPLTSLTDFFLCQLIIFCWSNLIQVSDLRTATVVGAGLAPARYTSTGYHAGGHVTANRADARPGGCKTRPYS